jgi:acetylornithine/N-succinyldiaminopimelate aminotransferase
MDAKEIIETGRERYLPVFGRYPVALAYGKGAELYDTDGKRYLDFFAGIAVNVLGHAHPALIKAITQQAGRLMHCSNYFHTQAQAELVGKLCSLSGLDRVFLTNSGTESVEGALKIARKYGRKNGGKFKIISAHNSFHGRTYGALTATGQPKYQKDFAPVLAGFEYFEFNNIEDLKNKFSDEICAVILEPVQGEGGVIAANPEFLAKAKELCLQNDALLVFDEVQCGLFRTGKPFCYEHYGIKPDIMTLAKALGGGFPIGAILCSEHASSFIEKGDHGSTFGGNPLACAAANAVIETAINENLAQRARKNGEYLAQRLNSLKPQFPFIKEVRGKGLLIGMELEKEGGEIIEKALDKGLMINCTAANVLRFCPPLIISEKDIDDMILILKEAMR